MQRRSFLRQALQTAATAGLSNLSRAPLAEALPTAVTPDASAAPLPAGAAAPLPADFLGLGYEMSSVAQPGLLSPENTRYIALLRNLGRSGVMRFGGIVADFTSYQPEGPAASDPKHTVITRRALQQLRAFLDQTGWNAIWSVNFGQGTLPEALTEARDVAQILGPHLLFLELGNEVDNYGCGGTPLRKPPYTYAEFRAEYARWHDALAAAVPGPRFAAPDTAESIDWVEQMAADARGTVQLLTTHFYRNAQQHGSAGQLATPDPALALKLQRLRQAARASGIPWRMCETNSFSGGGLPGVSNTLLGALWTLDYLLLLAANGCAGVNLETGVNQLGFISSYSPLQDDGHGVNSAGAPFYGMLAFAEAARGAAGVRVQPLADAPPGVTGYYLDRVGSPGTLVLINRGQGAYTRPGTQAVQTSDILRLRGDAELTAAGITLGNASVQPDGSWSAREVESGAHSALHVPPMSAAVVTGELRPAAPGRS